MADYPKSEFPDLRLHNLIAETLWKGFDGKPFDASQNYGASPELARAKVREWLVGDGYTFIHDADVAKDGLLYGTDEGHDILWVLNRETGKIEQHKLPDIDLPRGGIFSGMKLPIGQFTGKHGPHSMAQTSDGRIWITNALSSTMTRSTPTPSASTRTMWSGSPSSRPTRSGGSIPGPRR